MAETLYKATWTLVNAFEAVFKPQFQVKGLKQAGRHPTLFVPNHFIRTETVIIPYVLYKDTKKIHRSLADKRFFTGVLGDFLKGIGTISTAQPQRNRIIISDLITGKNNWVIYPEGLMVKNKAVIDERGNLLIQSPARTGPPRTGSAVLALKAELIRQGLKKQLLKKTSFATDQLHKYNLHPHELSALSLQITPVNITYYPLRPSQNRLSNLLEKVLDNVSARAKEEIKIESQLLFNSNIHITFCKPLDMEKYTKFWVGLLRFFPWSGDKKNNFIIRLLYRPLTKTFMQAIYKNVTINIDHLFSFYLFNSKAEVLDLPHLKHFILFSAYYIQSQKHFNHHPSLGRGIDTILTGESYKPFESILHFAFKSKALYLYNHHNHHGEKKILINRKLLVAESDFHSIRLENTLKVIYNEIKPLRALNRFLKKHQRWSQKKLRAPISNHLIKLDIEEYEKDYRQYYRSDFSKSPAVGRPFYFGVKKSKIGLVLSHGYKSAPLEVVELAKYLYGRKVSVYGVRLKGHGTHPQNIKDTSWKDWYHSYLRGVTALRGDCEKVILGGFSTGGTLALLTAARNPSLIEGVLSINSPLKLQDIKSKLTPAVNMWNEFLNWANIEKGKLEYIDSPPENPHINYSRNYVKGISELEKLMKVCREELKKITSPTLIIQARRDPVVNPKSADIIYQSVGASKQLMHLDLDHHVIVRGRGKEQVFKAVEQFVRA